MSLIPTLPERIARARSDLRMGAGVVVTDGSTSALVIAVEVLGAERLQSIRQLGSPLLALTARRAETLKARAYDGDIARVQVPTDASLSWLRALADPADDLLHPMKGPLICMRDGSADLERFAIQLSKEAQLLPAVLSVWLENGRAIADEHDLTFIDAKAAAPHIQSAAALHPVAHARLPMVASDAGRLHIFRPEDGSVEHYAVEIGQPDRSKPVLTRLHSACFTGDVLGSLKCDCGPQLHAALGAMGENGQGVLLYLNQEGRGIGLANKMRAYSLQDQGFDTVEANHRLGFEDDERDFRIGAQILRRMGFSSVKLMTNNPAKVARMQEQGIDVTERVPLQVGRTKLNAAYLDTKAKKSGHLL